MEHHGERQRGLAAAHCDSLLALDEIGEVQARDLGRMVYQLAGGMGKSRMSSETNLRPPRTWRTFILSTGETPVRVVIESEGKTARGGQTVRMADVPAKGDDGEIVLEPHDRPPAEFVLALKRACATYYGTAGPAFVRELCGQGDVAAISPAVQAGVASAASDLRPLSAVEEVMRVVRRFALVDVAGRMAVKAGILPHTKEEVRNAVLAVLRRWLTSHGTGGELDRAIARLRDFLLRNEARFRDADDGTLDTRDLAGYRDSRRRLYLLTPQGMKEALEGHSVQDVAAALKVKGWLFQNGKDRLLSKHRVAGVNHTINLYAVRDEFLEQVGDSGIEQPQPPSPGSGNSENSGNG